MEVRGGVSLRQKKALREMEGGREHKKEKESRLKSASHVMTLWLRSMPYTSVPASRGSIMNRDLGCDQ